MAISARTLENLPRIYTGRYSHIYFQKISDYSKPVVLKTLRDDSMPSREVERLANEYRVTKDLSIHGVRRCYDYIKIGLPPTLVLEYFEGASLLEECRKQPMDIMEILVMSISIVQALSELHRKKIMHRNISSTNLLVNRKDLTTAIIDFGIAMTAPPHSSGQEFQTALDGSYQYISPEQTGRTNRSIDFRTDLYSFGVVMYELLTKRLPFILSDPHELIHFHIARDPEPPHTLVPSIPRTLSNLVMKLMSKNPENRYQSANGLKIDLENCLTQLQKNGLITPFELAQQDFPEELRIRRKLYGRESEIQILVDAFENTCNGAGEIVLVSGEAGVGKSSLVDEIRLAVVEKGGYYITGTGDIYKQHTPHYLLLQAFGKLVDLILTESTENLLQRKEEITQALGKNVPLLIKAIPRLELIIGKQHVSPPEDAAELQVRLQNSFLDFVRVIARRQHPLVLFIDNLQWVDISSLGLISSLLSTAANQHLLFIGAYRNKEAGPSHPLTAVLEYLEINRRLIRKIHLSNLSKETLSTLVAEALRAKPPYAQSLSDMIHAKTAGNPFFALWFLQTLSESGLLVFDQTTRRWKWAGEQIRSMHISNNLVALMTQKISRLPRETQQLLSKAACIGNTFDFLTLSVIAEQSLTETSRQLEGAIEKGLIIPLDEDRLLPDNPKYMEKTRYRFPHIRVRQAAHGLLSRKLSRTTHLRIGRLRMGNKTVAELDEQLFDIVYHFNEGFQGIKDGREKLMLVELNLCAGLEAKRAAAYKEAIWYFSMGIGMLPEDKWKSHYDLTESLYLEAMEAEHLCSNTDRAELLFSELIQRTKNENVKAKALKTIEDARSQSLVRTYAQDKEPKASLPSQKRDSQNAGTDIVEEASRLDMNTVIKASQAIASEIELNRLLAKTLRIVIENAGAEKGFFIENINDKLIIQAEGRIGQNQIKTMQELPVEESGKVPLSIVNFVARTKTPVVLKDAFHDNVYGADEFIAQYRIKSLLCLPIIHKGALSGVVYLENNLATDIFTPDRLELLKVLSAQAAISMENARLYARQEQHIRELNQAEESLKLNFERSATLLKLNQMTGETLQEIMDFAFEEAVRLTKSKIGYLAFLNEEETVLTMQLWSRSVMAECDINEKPIDYQLDTVGLWGEAVRQRRPIITNDYTASNPWKRGYPEGHVKLRRHMNVPVFDGSRIVLVAGVGNKEEEYNETDVQQISLLMEGMWRLIERRKAEKALRETNEHFRSVLRAATAYSIISADPDGIIKVFNEGAELMLGYRADEVIDKVTPELFHDPDEITTRASEIGIKPGFEVFVSEARKGKTDTREWTYHHKNGSRITVSLTVTAMRTEAGELSGFIGIAQDITERKLIEEALFFISQGGWLAGSETFFEALVKFLGERLDIDYVLIDKIDGKTDVAESLAIYAKNAKIANLRYNLTGTPCENVMGKKLCIYPQNIQQLFPEDTLLAEMGVESYIGLPLWDSAGQPIGLIALMDCQPLFDTQLATQLLQLVAPRAAAELERGRSDRILRMREQEFRTLAENSPDNIARYDTSCRIVYLNPALEKTFGCPASKVLGTTPMEKSGLGTTFRNFQEKVIEVLKTGEESEIDLILPASGEEVCYHNVHFVAERGTDGAITGVLAIGRDVTERVLAETEIRLLNQELEQRVADRTLKLKEANRELEAFAYSVSHDLRAPLRHIDGYIDLLQKNLNMPLDEKSLHYLSIISKAAQKMGFLIDDLLSFSRMARQAMSFQSVELGALVRTVIQELEPDTTGRKIKWHIGNLPTVNGDASLLQMVMTNLIANALKFTRTQNQAVIEIGSLPNQESEVVIFVSDNGVGFDMAYVDKLFGVFQRLHRADEFEGTGIGLANVHRIITRHGGRVWAEAELDRGSKFYFSLPTIKQKLQTRSG